MKYFFLILITLSSCKVQNHHKALEKTLYFKTFNLLDLSFDDRLTRKIQLTYVKVQYENKKIVSAGLFFDSKRRTNKKLNSLKDGNTIFASTSFDGKFFTYYTLVKKGSELYEFRYEHSKYGSMNKETRYYTEPRKDSIVCKIVRYPHPNPLRVLSPFTDSIASFMESRPENELNWRLWAHGSVFYSEYQSTNTGPGANSEPIKVNFFWNLFYHPVFYSVKDNGLSRYKFIQVCYDLASIFL